MSKTVAEKVKLYFFSFMLYSFIGWIYEVILEFTYGHGFVNRGFLNGPYLPIYGFGALLILFSVRGFTRKKICIGKLSITPILVFILIFLITTIVEYISGTIIDILLPYRLWDYTGEFLNINGLICLKASMRFAIGGTVFLYLLQPFFEFLIKKIPQKAQTVLSVSVLAIVLADLVLTVSKYI